MMAALPSAMSQTHALPPACAAEKGRVIECVKPSESDPTIRRFDTAQYVVFNAKTGPDANLLVYLPGTGGVPPGPVKFFKAAADAGYRVISLAYNNIPGLMEAGATPAIGSLVRFFEGGRSRNRIS
jgi:hypothetical protein